MYPELSMDVRSFLKIGCRKPSEFWPSNLLMSLIRSLEDGIIEFDTTNRLWKTLHSSNVLPFWRGQAMHAIHSLCLVHSVVQNIPWIAKGCSGKTCFPRTDVMAKNRYCTIHPGFARDTVIANQLLQWKIEHWVRTLAIKLGVSQHYIQCPQQKKRSQSSHARFTN